ncbi:MAG TPA: group III truncated hemoglobin [Flavobacteriaceae bacterium]|nr:group III truncated hemoglobin [Flavobacteriaceae bacterium]
MELEKKDIETRKDIQLLVDTFYAKAREDELIGPIFNGVIKDKWPEHLEKLYRFWETVLLYKRSYRGSPFMPHSKLPIKKEHFDQWLKLFQETLDEHFTGKIADDAKWRSEKMAEMFQFKLEYYQGTDKKPLL